jgi:hypothetical protein
VFYHRRAWAVFGREASVIKTLGRMAALAALLTLTNCGVYGAKGNDTGGIIPWSPVAEQAAMETAQADCGTYGKYALITSVHRQPGDYIAYSCSWKPVRQILRAYR